MDIGSRPAWVSTLHGPSIDLIAQGSDNERCGISALSSRRWAVSFSNTKTPSTQSCCSRCDELFCMITMAESDQIHVGSLAQIAPALFPGNTGPGTSGSFPNDDDDDDDDECCSWIAPPARLHYALREISIVSMSSLFDGQRQPKLTIATSLDHQTRSALFGLNPPLSLCTTP